MTPKQEQFVREYLIDLNATQAALRCGYSEKSAYSQGQRLLKNAEVATAVATGRDRNLEKAGVTGERVINAIAQIAFGDIRQMFDANGALKRPDEWDDDTAASVAGLEIVTVNKGEGEVEHVAKIRRTDRLRALDMLARHHSLYNDKVEVTGLDALAERLARAGARDDD